MSLISLIMLPMYDLSFPSILSFFITVNASPSTQALLNPRSSANITDCKHALASAVVWSRILSHRGFPNGFSSISPNF
uniref:Uncharacterized protein n=1 Tax=Gossypium raimondii TaxID=29730 RepID=A0A0D2SNX7_GOSRA|nr:hypothetical protein B456_010G071600 [Gossypium raimondii]